MVKSKLSPNEYVDYHINKLCENCKNERSKKIFEDLTQKQEVQEYLIKICEDGKKKTNEYPLFTFVGINNAIREAFPEMFNETIVKYIRLAKYSEQDINIADSIINETGALIYCLKTLSKRHVREKEILLLLLFSGVSTAFRDRKMLLNCMCIGSSGKGKSSAMKLTSRVFSDSQVISSSSAKSMFYKAKEGLLPDNTVMILDEADNSKEAEALERAYTDTLPGKIAHETVTPDHTFERIEINQINAFWRNSINTPKDDEGQLANRYVIVSVDESSTQDKLVFKKTLDDFGFGNIESESDIKFSSIIIDILKSKEYKVFIPFIDLIESDNTSNRRTIKKFLSLLCSVTFFNQHKREKIKDFLIATIEDFEIAKLVWERLNKTESLQLPSQYITLLSILESKDEMTVQEICENPDISISEATVRRRLFDMQKQGLVDFEHRYDNNSSQKKYYFRAFQGVSKVCISFSKDKFSLESFKVSLERLLKKNNSKEFQNFKEHIDNVKLEELYQKITLKSVIYEKLKTLIENDKNIDSKPEIKQDEDFQVNENISKDSEDVEVTNLT